MCRVTRQGRIVCTLVACVLLFGSGPSGAVIPSADLAITKDDGVTSVLAGGSLVYTIVVSNAGPSADPAVTAADTLPAALTCTYTSITSGGATGNTAAGAGDLAETLSMPAGSSVSYTVVCDVSVGATGLLSNTATVSASVNDPDPLNNSATDNDTAVIAPTPVPAASHFTLALLALTLATASAFVLNRRRHLGA